MPVESRVYLIGAGPGHPGLLTKRAEYLIRKADIILYDHLVNPFILQYSKPGIEIIDVGKIPYTRHIRQEEINRLLVEKADEHRTVVRIKGGDPAVFGRVQEEVAVLEAAGIHCEIIPGITSASAAAAMLGLGLTSRDVSTNVTFTTGHFKESVDREICLSALLDGGTLAIYMGVKRMGHLMAQISSTTDVDYPVAVLFNATRHDTKLVCGKVSTIVGEVGGESGGSPAIIIIGDIVNLISVQAVSRLSQPGKRVLIRGARDEALGEAYDIYEAGGWCLIDDRDSAHMHESQRLWLEQLISENEFDEILECNNTSVY